jgi:hypothetical protein
MLLKRFEINYMFIEFVGNIKVLSGNTEHEDR